MILGLSTLTELVSGSFFAGLLIALFVAFLRAALGRTRL